MKKSRLLILALVLAVVLVAVYRIANRPPSAEYTPEARVAAILIKGGCLSCHTADAELPFYAKLPVAGKVIQQDIDSGFRAFDIEPLYEALVAGQLPRPVDVAKVEKVAIDKRMPQPKYYLVHWGSQMTAAKSSIVAQWAEQWRAAHYNDGLGGEPIRPIADKLEYDEAKAELGRILYHDTRLSVDNTVSCASCHGLNTAGVDNKQYSEGVGGQFGGVNAPTVYNAVYNFVQFWDGRAATLALQAAGPPLNPVEMGCESFDQIIAKLSKDRALTRAFKAVYPDWHYEGESTEIELKKYIVTG